jgi:hypothetical protein
MLNYEVTLEVDPSLVGAVEAYMQTKHIPELWQTGCFDYIVFARAGGTRFRTSYRAPDQAALDTYFAQHAQALRDDFARHFPSGVSPARETWATVRTWGNAE